MNACHVNMIKLTHLLHFHVLTQRLYEYQYSFDAAGNRTQMIYFDGSANHTTSYTYNNGNQLTEREVNGLIYSYGYDNNGNMIGEHDDEGMVTLRTFQWNTDNRMTKAVKYGTGYESYAYDALGRRIARSSTDDGISKLYYYDGLTVIAEKVQEEGDPWYWSRIFTVGPGVIGNIFRISTNNGSSWSDTYYHYDAIGNVALRTNSSGGVVESIDQEAYGNVKVGSQSGYHLTTKEYDSLPELYYFWQRWYAPEIGRFISKANWPVYDEHPYNISKSNPIQLIDPFGRYPYYCYDSVAERAREAFTDCKDKCKGFGIPKCGTKAARQCKCMSDCLSNHIFADEARVCGWVREVSCYYADFGIFQYMHRQCQYYSRGFGSIGTTDTWSSPICDNGYLYGDPPTYYDY